MGEPDGLNQANCRAKGSIPDPIGSSFQRIETRIAYLSEVLRPIFSSPAELSIRQWRLNLSEINRPIDFLSLINIVTKNWFLFLGAIAVVSAALYFLMPATPASYAGTAILATNGAASLSLVDEVLSHSQAANLQIVADSSSVKITSSSGLASKDEVKTVLESAMAPFIAAARVEGADRDEAQATKDRTDREIAALNDTMSALRASPPTPAGDGYNLSNYANSVLALSVRLSRLDAAKFDLDRQLNLPLAVSGVVRYDLVERRGTSRIVLIVVAAFGAGFLILLWLVALEALRRREPSPGN